MNIAVSVKNNSIFKEILKTPVCARCGCDQTCIFNSDGATLAADLVVGTGTQVETIE